MVNEDEEGISIPAVPKPIPKPIPRPASEREMPEAPSPEKPVPVERRAEKPIPRVERAHPRSPPPLFIKIDKYQEVVDNLQKLKYIALGIRDALDALADIEKELTTGITIAHKALDDFNTIISMLDSKLTRVGEIGTGKKTGTAGEVDTYVRNIYSQMDKIKQELKNVEQEI
ncbi:MAG: hypothetical protein JSW41_01100 [Candidatus Aenigmatarchaeota archaeon]|nr:MAG: hypothetical protein JSW41_01100 [Candidatus Aenigmarchaeota archaeon]